MPEQESQIRFQALLPFYVNNTLSIDDRTFVEQYLQEHPDAQAQLKFEQYLIAAMREPVSERADDAGLNALLKSCRQSPKRNSFKERLQDIFSDWGLTPAFAVAAVLVIVQSAMLINLQLNNASDPTLSFTQKFRSMLGIESNQQFFKLSIAPNAEYAQVIQLIKDTGCHIQDGPTASGALLLSCPVDEVVQQQLQSSPLVDDVIQEKAP